jgi:hypothetical protein
MPGDVARSSLMNEEFDDFLVSALAPPGRDPDRHFVRQVQARVLLEEYLEARQRSVLAGLARQLAVLVVVAVPMWWLSRAAPIAFWLAESPALTLASLLTGFLFLVAMLTVRPGISVGFFQEN